ncbi:MAG: leucine-rich repeat protein [Tannerella sp.]|jgi:uncharacterized repeat protein (TIGR02543 family)|nr:leucine-rich repeat protein [Tannerella sp.]
MRVTLILSAIVLIGIVSGIVSCSKDDPTEEANVEYWQVSWNLNGGTWPEGDNHATQVVKGGTLSEPAKPVKTGATFDRWYTEEALSNKISFPYDVSSVTANFTLYAGWTSGGSEEAGDRKMFTSIATLSSWLSGQPKNTVAKAYNVGLTGVNLDSGNNWNDVGIVIGDNGDKYVDLDLSGCTGTAIPDGKAVGGSGKITYYGTFVHCDNLVAIKLPEGLTIIGKYVFRYCEALVSVILPQTVKSVNAYAFHMCEKLESVNLPESLQTIERYAFFACPLVSVVIPEGITTISESSFAGVVSIMLPESLQTIEDYAFWDSRKLTSVLIPTGVESIGDCAFDYCENLTEVIMLPVTPPALKKSPGSGKYNNFSHAMGRYPSSLRIKVPAGSVDAYKAAVGWENFADLIVTNTN